MISTTIYFSGSTIRYKLYVESPWLGEPCYAGKWDDNETE